MTDNNLDLINVLAGLSDDDLDRVHEAVEAEQRKRAADELVRLAEADHMYDHYRDQG